MRFRKSYFCQDKSESLNSNLLLCLQHKSTTSYHEKNYTPFRYHICIELVVGCSNKATDGQY